jgi:hypothetical protein
MIKICTCCIFLHISFLYKKKNSFIFLIKKIIYSFVKLKNNQEKKNLSRLGFLIASVSYRVVFECFFFNLF